MFSRSDGSALQPDMLRRKVLYPTLDRLQIPRSRGCADLHTFRHSAGSFVNTETGNLKLAQKLLGHSNLSLCGACAAQMEIVAERNGIVVRRRVPPSIGA